MKAVLILLCAALGASAQIRFAVARAGGVIADLEMSSPGADWAAAGREAALATVSVAGLPSHHVMLYAGAARHTYRVFLGRLAAGTHELKVERHPEYSARGAGLEVHAVRTQASPPDELFDHAPVLFARDNTVGRFSDVPLLVYAERVMENGRASLQYSVIFSNEDGGTSTRKLMARWGRATDIEYVYKVDPATGSATVQGRDHRNVPFKGPYWDRHPMLIPVTDNNMVSGETNSPVRYQIAPIPLNLERIPREQVMVEHPVSWQVMTKELIREEKLRVYGTVDGEKISDPRNYLYVQYNAQNRDAALAVSVRLKGSEKSQSSALGQLDCAIARDGWVETAVELPPGTRAGQIAELRFDCLFSTPSDKSPKPPGGHCRLKELGRVFLLDRDSLPGPNIWTWPAAADLKTGEAAVLESRAP